MVTLLVALAGGCSGDGAPPTVGGGAPTRPCGDTTCPESSFCVATQGAVCMPLPAEGEACEQGCVKTEHCCNCTAHACVDAPAAGCADGPTCACLNDVGDEVLPYCGPDRRECNDTPEGPDVVCVAVALDEDPFAE
ncbi:MAG: hypothetical protein RIF41_27460, partial [Polyangiaceae bacterium]